MSIAPMPGRALIAPDKTPDEIGDIYLPDISKKGLLSGVVSEISYGKPRKCVRCGRMHTTQAKCRSCGNNLRILSQDPHNPLGCDPVGNRVLFSEYSIFILSDGSYIVPVDNIEAIIPMGAEFDAESTAHRCKHCGPAKEGTGNGLMMVADDKGEMYCPRCGMYANGVKKSGFKTKFA